MVVFESRALGDISPQNDQYGITNKGVQQKEPVPTGRFRGGWHGSPIREYPSNDVFMWYR